MSTDFNSVQWTADNLLAEVLSACRFPPNGTVDYTPAVLMRRASDAIWGWATHQISTSRDGRMSAFLTRDVATQYIDADGDEFELPPMAVADTLDSVSWRSSEGGADLRLQLIALGQEALYTGTFGQDTPGCYLLLDGRVRVIPKPSAGGQIKITYLRRHGQLVLASDPSTAAITNLTGASIPVLTVTPVAFPFAVGQWVDVISRYYPYRFKVHGAVITAVDSVAGTVTLGKEKAATLNQVAPVGDYLALCGLTRFVHLPLEMRVSLTKRIAVDVLNEIGDVTLSNQLAGFAEQEAVRSRDMLSPRVKSDREKIVSRNSLARRGVRGGGKWGG